MAREAFEAMYAALHKDAPWHDGSFTDWVKEQSTAHPFRSESGVQIGVADRDLAPWDKFTTEHEASPQRPTDEG